MTDNFDLQGWMREQKQGPYTGANGIEKVIFKSSKPKSKTGLNEGLMGMMDLQAINSIMREEMDEDFDTATTAEVYVSPSGEHEATIEFNGKTARVIERTGEDIDKFWKMIAKAAKKMGATYIHSEENDPETESIEDILSSSMNEDQEMDEAHNMMPIQQKWELIPIDRKEEMLDSVDSSEEGLADYAYMGWAMVPDEIKSQLEMLVNKEPVSTPDEDEDEKTSAMAMKQAKKGAKAVKGLNPTKDIHDLLYGDDEEDGDLY